MEHEVRKGVISKLREERLCLRYAISGSLTLEIAGQRCCGSPKLISIGGILFQSDTKFPRGARGTMWLEVYGFNDMIVSSVRIVRTEGHFTAAVFLMPPFDLERLISLLANE